MTLHKGGHHGKRKKEARQKGHLHEVKRNPDFSPVGESPDLRFIAIDDLISEINRRYDHWIFCGMQCGMRGPDTTMMTRKWRGNAATCMGLAGQMQIAVYDMSMEKEISGYPE